MGRYHSGLGAFVTMITVIVMVTGAILLNDGSLKTTDLLTSTDYRPTTSLRRLSTDIRYPISPRSTRWTRRRSLCSTKRIVIGLSSKEGHYGD